VDELNTSNLHLGGSMDGIIVGGDIPAGIMVGVISGVEENHVTIAKGYGYLWVSISFCYFFLCKLLQSW